MPWATPLPLQTSMPRVSQHREWAAQGQGLVRGSLQPSHSKAGLSGETTPIGQWELAFLPCPMGTPGVLLPVFSRLGGWALTPGGKQSRRGLSQVACVGCSPATTLVITPSHTLPEGTGANLTCSVSREASGPANFSWFRNGALWTQGPLETVTLLPVARTDAAVYACRILTEAGAQLSTPVVLSVLCG